MLIASLLLIGIFAGSFCYTYWFFDSANTDLTYILTDVVSVLAGILFVTGLYCFVTDIKKTTRLPIKEDGLS